jgi:hypothetical protein
MLAYNDIMMSMGNLSYSMMDAESLLALSEALDDIIEFINMQGETSKKPMISQASMVLVRMLNENMNYSSDYEIDPKLINTSYIPISVEVLKKLASAGSSLINSSSGDNKTQKAIVASMLIGLNRVAGGMMPNTENLTVSYPSLSMQMKKVQPSTLENSTLNIGIEDKFNVNVDLSDSVF